MVWTKIEWRNYIAEINARYRAKRQISGFTGWAIFGFLIVIGYRLFTNISSITLSSDDLLILSTLFVWFYSLVTTIKVMYFDLHEISSPPENNTRVLDISKDKTALTMFPFCLLLFVLIIFISNLIQYYNNYYSNLMTFTTIIFILYGILYFLLLMALVLVTALKLRFIRVRQKLPMKVGHPSKYRSFFNIILIPICLLLLGIFYLSLNELNTIFPFISHQEYYEFAIELVIIMELIRIYLRLQVIDIQVDRLESLETRIMVDDLEVDEIRSEFLKVFLGESTLEWLLKIQSELKNSQIIFQSSLSEIEKEINEFEKIDVNYQTEINTRYMAINEKLSKTTEDYLSEAKNRLIEIEIFSKQGILNSKEKEAVNSFHKEIKAQLGSAENEYNEISHRFKSTIKHKIMKTS